MEVALSEATEVLFYIDRCKRKGIPLIRAFKACGVDIIIKGKGSAQAHREAISIFEKGVEIGCGDCAKEISNLHRFGRIKGASEEGRAWWLEKARKLWEKQALGGDAYSADSLANSYRNSDKVKCKFWRNKAIEIDKSYIEFYKDQTTNN